MNMLPNPECPVPVTYSDVSRVQFPASWNARITLRRRSSSASVGREVGIGVGSEVGEGVA